MRKLAMKIQKAPALVKNGGYIELGADYGHKRLTEEEFERLRNEVCSTVADAMLTDCLLVVLDILENHIGCVYRNKAERMATFGEMFKARLKEQSRTHSNEFYPLLKRAGLTRLEYG